MEATARLTLLPRNIYCASREGAHWAATRSNRAQTCALRIAIQHYTAVRQNGGMGQAVAAHSMLINLFSQLRKVLGWTDKLFRSRMPDLEAIRDDFGQRKSTIIAKILESCGSEELLLHLIPNFIQKR
jgi:hypothetical protein